MSLISKLVGIQKPSTLKSGAFHPVELDNYLHEAAFYECLPDEIAMHLGVEKHRIIYALGDGREKIRQRAQKYILQADYVPPAPVRPEPPKPAPPNVNEQTVKIAKLQGKVIDLETHLLFPAEKVKFDRMVREGKTISEAGAILQAEREKAMEYYEQRKMDERRRMGGRFK